MRYREHQNQRSRNKITLTGKSMSKIPSQTICLAVLIKPNTSLSDASLHSFRPFIDNFIVYSQGLDKQNEARIKNTLMSIDGQFVSQKIKHYGESKNDLIRRAQQQADWVLLINADEELCCLQPHLNLPTKGAVGIIDIVRGHFVTSEARLFKSSVDASFKYPIGPEVSHPGVQASAISSFKLHSQAAKAEWSADQIANRFLLDAVLGKFKQSSDLLLALGQIELANGQHELALAHFERVSKLEGIQERAPSISDLWMAHYLSGAIYSKKRNFTQAIQHWQAAFELAPNRAEPLFRLAELHFNERDFSTAALLAKQANSIDKPRAVSYHEPSIYTHTAAILNAKAWHQLGRSDGAIKLLSALSEKHQSKAVAKELSSVLSEIKAAADTETQSSEQSNTQQIDALGTCASTPPKLTIGMATHDDFDGVYFSVMSLVLHHKECLDDFEILIIDNNPDSKHGASNSKLAQRVPNVRYVAAEEYRGTAIRERVFQEARGQYVICMDCHVLLHQGVVQNLINYFDANADSKDILHGPIYYDNHSNFSTHMNPEWNEGFYGRWGRNELGGNDRNDAFEIPMQGLGLFACVKASWPGFNLKFRGFGGEEGYIHEKFRQRGGRALCLPFLRWTHRFDRPNAPTYLNSWEDRLRNYLIGWDELGLNTQPILTHFSTLLGERLTHSIYARFLLEKKSPLWKFDTIYFYSKQVIEPEVLNKYGAQRTIRVCCSKVELRSLFEQAIERKIPNVLLMVSKTSDNEALASAITKMMPKIAQIDTVVKAVQLLNSPDFQVALLDNKAMSLAISLVTQSNDADIGFELSQLENTQALAV